MKPRGRISEVRSRELWSPMETAGSSVVASLVALLKGVEKSLWKQRMLCGPIDPYWSALGHTGMVALLLLVNGCCCSQVLSQG